MYTSISLNLHKKKTKNFAGPVGQYSLKELIKIAAGGLRRDNPSHGQILGVP